MGFASGLFLEVDLSHTVQKQLPELDALVTFYEKICVSLPTDELLPKLVTERVITITDKSKIVNTGKTEFERTQYLLDHYISKPLSTGDPKFFYILLDLMSTTSKCDFLVNEIQQYLSTALTHQKFSGKFKRYIRCIFTMYVYVCSIIIYVNKYL